MTQKSKRYYPAFLDLTGRTVIVVGSGRPAERKARQMAKYGAIVVLITPSPSVAILQSQVEGLLDVEQRSYVRGDLEGASLVFCLDPDEETRKAVAAEARAVGCPVNVAGEPDLTSFMVPGVVHREPLQIAISTSGVAPQLAKHLRRSLAQQFGEEWGAYTRLLAGVRAIAMARLDSADAVDEVLAAAIASDLLERVRKDAAPSADEAYEEFAPPASEDDAADDADAPPAAEDDDADAADDPAGEGS